jgi:hypothetical protein
MAQNLVLRPWPVADVVWDWLIGSGLTQLLGLFSLCAPVAVHTVTMEIAGKYQ